MNYCGVFLLLHVVRLTLGLEDTLEATGPRRERQRETQLGQNNSYPNQDSPDKNNTCRLSTTAKLLIQSVQAQTQGTALLNTERSALMNSTGRRQQTRVRRLQTLISPGPLSFIKTLPSNKEHGNGPISSPRLKLIAHKGPMQRNDNVPRSIFFRVSS